MPDTSDRFPLKIGFKIWFEKNEGNDSVPLLGETKIELLRTIRDTGSILSAAKHLDIDFKKAWEMLTDIKQKLEPIKIVESERGRKGTHLTDAALELIGLYEHLARKVESFLNTISINLEYWKVDSQSNSRKK